VTSSEGEGRRRRLTGLQPPSARPQGAIALEYSGHGAPRVTAKGRGTLAEAILEIAAAHGVPVHEDPELLEALARIDLGEEIPHELYVAIAEVLAFAYWLSGKHRPGLGPPEEPGRSR